MAMQITSLILMALCAVACIAEPPNSPDIVPTGNVLRDRTLKYQCRHWLSTPNANDPTQAICTEITKCPPGSAQFRIKNKVLKKSNTGSLYNVDWRCEGENKLMSVEIANGSVSATYKNAKPSPGVKDEKYYVTCAFFQANGKNTLECNYNDYCIGKAGKLDCVEVNPFGGSWTGDLAMGLTAKFDSIDPKKHKPEGQGCLSAGLINKGKCTCQQARDGHFLPLSWDQVGPQCTKDGKFAKRQLNFVDSHTWCVSDKYSVTSASYFLGTEAMPDCDDPNA